MPAAKQQRRAVTASSKAKTSQHASSTISSFARVSKTVGHASAKKVPGPVTPKKDIRLEAITPASRKRKIVASVEEVSSADEGPSRLKLRRKLTLAASSSSSCSSSITKSTTNATVSATTTTTATPTQPVKRGRGRPPKNPRPEPTPRKRVRSPSVSDSDVSSIDAGALFKKLRLESSPSRSSSPLTANTSVVGSDVESDAKQPAKPGQLPDEVLNLIALHTAFLKTVTLHHAHHGSAAPMDLRVLCPNIARAWGKKRVTDAEIRTCLAVLGESPPSPSSGTGTGNISSPFRLSDYGRGKICVEIDPGRNPGPLNENKLNALFRANISALWARFLANRDGSGVVDASAAFLATLPKVPVTLCESVVKASPIMLKGQQRLEDLKHGIAMKRQEKDRKPSPLTTTTTTTTTSTAPADAPKLSLLDRIRLKAQQKSALPAGLSPAQLERRAALQRVEEVSALVAMLSRAAGDTAGGDGGGRVSFPMAALLEKLKDSFRMGISRPEGAACVRLLAAEVAPEWVRVVALAGREHVVVEMGRQIGKGEVAGRVRDILERE
ncbi:hypothetical protein F5X97DRAFT_341616 [Nemania serpens]|nr:hypothetical protein F5X97DRAFT_341616 [Nemania serpens]